MTFIDLFAGIGGFRIALEDLGLKCVFSSEIDKNAIKTYQANFGEIPAGDIRKIDVNDIPDFDILCAGFPCQPFSVAGKRKGLQDDRGNLFKEIVRIADHKKPKVLFLENVKGLVNHDNGNSLREIVNSLLHIGYDVNFKVLRACDYGLPTFRPRLYIVAFNGHREFIFPQPVPLRFTLSDVFEQKCEKDIAYTFRKGGLGSAFNDRHNWQKYKIYSDGELLEMDGISRIFNEDSPRTRTLTINEAKRIMGFPEAFIFPGSYNQAMKQLGNSVAVDVIKAIGKQIIKVLK